MRSVEEFDDAEPFVDRFEQGAVAFLAFRKRFLGFTQTCRVAISRLEASILGFEGLQPLDEVVDLLRCHELPLIGDATIVSFFATGGRDRITTSES